MTEAQYALKFIDYFAEFDIYKEVPGGGGIIDIVAVKSGIRTAIEVKTQLSFDVMHQAFQSKVQAHYAYAAVPVKDHGKEYLNWKLHPAQIDLCNHYGIGVLGCMQRNKIYHVADRPPETWYEIREIIKPSFNRHARKIFLHDYMKRSQAGSQSSRMTAFGYFVECFTTVVARRVDGIDVKEAFEQIEFKHYRTLSLFKNAVVLYCRTNVIKHVYFDKGRFYYKKPEDHDNTSLLKKP